MKSFIISNLMADAMLSGSLEAGELRARRENQQDRIAQGVTSGQLTARETSRLENKDARLNREIADDRFRNCGNLTNNERARSIISRTC